LASLVEFNPKVTPKKTPVLGEALFLLGCTKEKAETTMDTTSKITTRTSQSLLIILNLSGRE
jgi:hypothetical protein